MVTAGLCESRVRMVTARLCELETLGARDYHSARSLTTTICFPGIMYSALSNVWFALFVARLHGISTC
jgi:hypothetical protein